MDKSYIWAILIVVGVFIGIFCLLFWLFNELFFLFLGILKAGGVSLPMATTISLILIVVIFLFCCCYSSGD